MMKEIYTKRLRLIGLFLAAVICLPLLSLNGLAAGQATTTVSGVNIGRGADETIIYNTAGTTTGTNQWGYEVVVGSDGKIKSVGGNNNLIPTGGFVISAHGTAITFLKENASVGRYARFIERQMMLTIDDKPVLPFYSVEYSFNKVNGARYTDQIVIYTGNSYTGTNQWGYEVTVGKNGIIASIGGNNSAIPSGGFVISGHGEGADLLRRIALVGMSASYDASKLTFTLEFSDESLILYIEDLVKTAEDGLQQARENYCAVTDDADAVLAAIKSDTSKAINNYRKSVIDEYGLDDFATELEERCEAFRVSISESLPFEYRGVWIRPVEKTRAAVHETVKKLYDLGANTICIETQFDCCTIFPTPKNCLMQQNPGFNGFDVLQAYIEECHGLGMELHCWIPVFYVGNVESANKDISVFAKRPDLFVKNNNGITAESEENGFMMLDPSEPEAVEFLLDLYEYLLNDYDIDCLQLDYIRYESRGDIDWGYFSNASAAFKAKYGFEPTYNTSASWWTAWCNIRCGYVTDFVRKVRALVDEVAPDVLLSADVFSNLPTTTTSIYQDTATWVKEGLLDILHPMTYGENSPYASVPDFIEICKGKCLLVPGIGAFMTEVDAAVMRNQIEYMRNVNVYGNIVFESSGFLAKATRPIVVQGVYSTHAPSPLRDTYAAIDAAAEYFKNKIAFISADGEYTKAEKAKLDELLDKAAEGLKNGSSAEAQKFIEALTSSGSRNAKNAINVPADMFKSFIKLTEKAFGKQNEPNNDAIYKKLYLNEKTDKQALASVLGENVEVVKVESEGTYIGTGDTVYAVEDNTEYVYTAIVRGDVNGDGSINATDYAMVKRVVLKTYDLDGIYNEAACVGGSEIPDAVDYVMIKRHVLGTYKITTQHSL